MVKKRVVNTRLLTVISKKILKEYYNLATINFRTYENNSNSANAGWKFFRFPFLILKNQKLSAIHFLFLNFLILLSFYPVVQFFHLILASFHQEHFHIPLHPSNLYLQNNS